ncbi:hypothetical protein HY638_01550 [Candidatus Woesearchaeota archaeon]|nr:hypothetical protein [Candidatus Woesearchaeota archaeon]
MGIKSIDDLFVEKGLPSHARLFTDDNILRMAAYRFRRKWGYSSGVAYLGAGLNLWLNAARNPNYKNPGRETNLIRTLDRVIGDYLENPEPYFMIWGVGGAAKEARLIGDIMKKGGYEKGKVHIGVVDASQSVLDYGCGHLQLILEIADYKPEIVQVKRPFEVMPKYADDIFKVMDIFSEKPVMHIMLGNTAFNEDVSSIDANDSRFLNFVRDSMKPIDLLILGFQMISEDKDLRVKHIDETVAEYDIAEFRALVTHNIKNVMGLEESPNPENIKPIFDNALSQVQFLYEYQVPGSTIKIPIYVSGKHTEKSVRRKMRNSGFETVFMYALSGNGEESYHVAGSKTSLPSGGKFTYGILMARPTSVLLSREEYFEAIEEIRPGLSEGKHDKKYLRDYFGEQISRLRAQRQPSDEFFLSASEKESRLLSAAREMLAKPDRFRYHPKPYDFTFEGTTRNQVKELITIT